MSWRCFYLEVTSRAQSVIEANLTLLHTLTDSITHTQTGTHLRSQCAGLTYYKQESLAHSHGCLHCTCYRGEKLNWLVFPLNILNAYLFFYVTRIWIPVKREIVSKLNDTLLHCRQTLRGGSFVQSCQLHAEFSIKLQSWAELRIQDVFKNNNCSFLCFYTCLICWRFFSVVACLHHTRMSRATSMSLLLIAYLQWRCGG